jgi:hypothetical protein
MVVVRLRVAGYAEKVRTRSLGLVDMNRTLPETALNTKHVWPVWLRTDNLKSNWSLYRLYTNAGRCLPLD